MNQSTALVPSQAELRRIQKFILWCRDNSVSLEQVITPGISLSFEMAPQAATPVEIPDTPSERSVPDPVNMYEDMRRKRQ